MPHLRRTLLALVLPLLVAPAGALAAPAPAPAGPEVARLGDVSLHAKDDAGDPQLCITLVRDGQDGFGGGTGCGDQDEPRALATLVQDDLGVAVGVAVRAEVASVELWRRGRRVGAASTVAGEAYTGRAAGRVRFAVVRSPEAGEGLRARLLDEAGAVLDTLDAQQGDPVVGRRTLLSGGSGRSAWRVRLQSSSVLAPTVIEPTRERTSSCTSVEIPQASGLSCVVAGLGEPLDTLLRGPADQASTSDSCAPAFRLVHGGARAGTRSVEVVLGSGRRLRARTARLPDGTLVWAVRLAAGDAARAVVLRSAGGARRLALGAAPLRVSCASGQGGASFAGFGPGDLASLDDLLSSPPALPPGGAVADVEVPGQGTMRVADGPDGSLCVALPGRAFTAFGCRAPTPSLDDTDGAIDSFKSPRTFALAVPSRVARVEVDLVGGGTVGVDTVAGEGYTGPYAGAVRFATLSAPSGRRLGTLRYLASDGRVLRRESDPGSGTARTAPVPVRIAGRPGRPSLFRTRPAGGLDAFSCLTLTTGSAPSRLSCDAVGLRPVVLLRSACGPRRTLAVAVSVAPGRRVEAVLADGRRRRVPLDRRGNGVLDLGADAGLREVVVRRRRTAQVAPVLAPSARAQCGWGASATVLKGTEPDRSRNSGGTQALRG